jgi:hypothetical protein
MQTITQNMLISKVIVTKNFLNSYEKLKFCWLLIKLPLSTTCLVAEATAAILECHIEHHIEQQMSLIG